MKEKSKLLKLVVVAKLLFTHGNRGSLRFYLTVVGTNIG